MEILQPLWEVGKCLWFPLKHRLNNVNKFQENFEKLHQEAQSLYTRRTDVNREIERDKVLNVPTSECEAWLKKVGEIENKVNEIEAKFKENKTCLGEWCLDIWWRIKLGKHIMTMIDDIAELKKKSKFEGGVVVVAPPGIVELTLAPTIEADTSTGRTIQEILRCLRDDKIGKIGVWGMGGVGKTTILNNLNNSPEIILMFQIIFWVTVSKDWNLKKFQQDIAKRLSLKLEDKESDYRVSIKLYRKLRTMKYLLLLDDVWDRVDLEAVGVPIPSQENDCKIVLTSRFLDVCRQMETDTDIKVEVLSEKEAWDLFNNKVGDISDSSNIEPLARKIVKECGGLPLVLIVIGRSLRKVNDVQVWRNALTELKRATFDIDVNMEKSVFMQLKFSYDRLKDDNLKNCFLYCALYPEDFKIPVRELIEHWWVEGFIDGNLNFGEAYDKGHAILKDLIDASLLEIIEHLHPFEKVKMHDVIRDLALRITSPNGEGFCTFVVKAGLTTIALPNERDWEQAKRMSLMHTDLTFLPMRPKCALLTTLLMQNNSDLEEFPESFFEQMHSLRVLNLSRTGIKALPSSLLNLSSLRGLYLSYCRFLHTLSSGVGYLTRLEVLHLGRDVKYLPIEVGQLIHLRSLRVHFSNDPSVSPSHILPNGLLSRLTLLEDLSICMDEETLSFWFTKYTKSVVEELVNLKHLISLHFHFPSVVYLEHFLQRSRWNEKCFTSFRFVVGIFNFHLDGGDRYLGWSGDDAITTVVMREVLSRSRGFFLHDHNSCKKLSDVCNMEMMNQLQFCYVKRCDAIETIIDGNGFSNLVLFGMRELPELRSIWQRTVPPQSVTFLRELEINFCPKLSNIFLWGMIQHLSNLQILFVNGCLEIEEIVSEEDMAMVVDNNEDMAVVLFPRLTKLHLYRLPKLIRLCKRIPKPVAWPSLQELKIEECPNLKKFPLSSSRAPALTRVIGKDAVELEYEDDATKYHVCRAQVR